MSRLIETTILFLACGMLPAQEGRKGEAAKPAPKADATQEKPEAKSAATEQFEELAKKHAERMQTIAKVAGRGEQMTAATEALTRRVEDLKGFLAAGYKLTAVQPFDLFPQTRHLECVITLVR